MTQPVRLIHFLLKVNFITAAALATMFIISTVTATQAQTFTVLHTFTGGQDGGSPMPA
ncbi:MAG: hypothetical protein ACLPND_22010 [Candidatus Korobacteraceae bacterium]